MAREETGMLWRQRDHIKRNIERLVNNTDYFKLINTCVECDLISPVMRDEIDRDKTSPHKKLFHKITRRGPEAYEKLKKICGDLQYFEAVRLLNELDGIGDDHTIQSIQENKRNLAQRLHQQESESDTLGPEKSSDDCPELMPYDGVIESKYTVEKSKHLHNDPTLGVYPMRSKNNRGILFLVNIIDFQGRKRPRRNGAEHDTMSLMHLFTEFGFKIFAYENLKKEYFFKLLRELLNSNYARDTECFVLALMSHGDNCNKQYVEFHDAAIVDVDEIVHCFRHEESPNLVNKPKILIFPFCRGQGVDLGYLPGKPTTTGTMANFKIASNKIETDGQGNTSIRTQNISSRSDTIICYASVSGFETHRHPDVGSWYIQTFYREMARYAHDHSFENILKIIQKETQKERSDINSLQTGSYVNEGFNKALFFNPGFWDIDEDKRKVEP